MNTIWLGYIFALISSVFSAVYVVPKKLSAQRPVAYAMIMGLGYFSASVIAFAFINVVLKMDNVLFHPLMLLACLKGVVWTIASVSILTAIDRMGLAKSNQWKSLQGPIGAFLMLAILSEFMTAKVVFILLAILFLTSAAMMFSTRENHDEKVDKKGITYSIIAAFFYGIAALIEKFLTNTGFMFSQQVYTSLFIFISSATYIFIKDKSLIKLTLISKKEIALPFVGGLLYFGNGYFSILGYRYIEGSIAFMLHQLNAVWLFLFGVFIFKEINFKKHWLRLSIGLVFSLVGVYMLVMAK